MSERDALITLSAELGATPTLVQAAGGNTSIKSNGVMWIKASGTWLAEAKSKNIFVPLDLKRLNEALLKGDPACESCASFVRQDLTSSNLRPSIETSVHGLMKQNVVLHVHCVNCISIAIQENSEQQFAALLNGFNWAYVPYARPGLSLAHAIRRVLKPNTEILILANHGLVVAGNTVAEANKLLRKVMQALSQPARRQTKPDINRLLEISKGTHYRLPHDPSCHGFAMALWSCNAATRHSYYPDHAVFLGATIPNSFDKKSMAVAMRGSGVLVHRDAGPSVEPMLRCLSEVFARLTAKSKLRPLKDDDLMALLNWDAETYRQSLSKN
jgi:rhamnose utilization protein RhaD (predicted bifunctional aldolase and dehydrogenase)